jgi:signal transduction histidine kinase
LAGDAIELVFRLAPSVGSISVDPAQLEQALVNLVINSRDAMPGGGRITIETDHVLFDEVYVRTHSGARAGEFVMIAVSDTGHGMDAETKRRLFEPFFTTKPEGKGTGLGLAAVYGTVKQSSGEIRVYSEPGAGTVIRMYFPRLTAGEAAK